MTFGQFTSYFAANQNQVPAALASEIRRTAKARLIERMQSGYGDCLLDFSDLIQRMEASVAGK